MSWEHHPCPARQQALNTFAKRGYPGTRVGTQIEAAQAVQAAIADTEPRSAERTAILKDLGLDPVMIRGTAPVPGRSRRVEVNDRKVQLSNTGQAVLIVDDRSADPKIAVRTKLGPEDVTISAGGRSIALTSSTRNPQTVIDLSTVDLTRLTQQALAVADGLAASKTVPSRSITPAIRFTAGL